MANAKQLQKTLQNLFEIQQDNQRLRDHLEGVRMDEAFSGLTWFWGPVLYERNRVIFRPFILNHFSDWQPVSSWRWKRIKWSDHQDRLEPWLDQTRKNRDIQLVRKLLSWKYANNKWGIDQKRWNIALVNDYQSANSPAARAIILDEYDTWFNLDEDTALSLYETDTASAHFIGEHLPVSYWGEKKRAMWTRLGDRAKQQGDEEFFFKLYRTLIPVDQWNTDALTLANTISKVDKLNNELEKRHPKGWDLKREDTLLALLKARERDVFPYIRSKLEETFGGWYNDKTDDLIKLAKQKGWWDLHTAAIRTSSDTKFFNKAINELLDKRGIDENTRIERLKALAGVSREWNWPGIGLARIHSLDDKIAQKLYLRYPDLVKGPFLANVTPRWWNSSKALLEAALDQEDNELVDILSARYVTRTYYSYSGVANQDTQETDELADYYQKIRDRDPKVFAMRAANVLTRVPAYATYSVAHLLKTNALARLLFVRSFNAYLSVPGAVQDLIEGSNIHVQKLAYRVLAQNDPRAQTLAEENIDILLGTLLRPIHRSTRIPAFSALANAAKKTSRSLKKFIPRQGRL